MNINPNHQEKIPMKRKMSDRLYPGEAPKIIAGVDYGVVKPVVISSKNLSDREHKHQIHCITASSRTHPQMVYQKWLQFEKAKHTEIQDIEKRSPKITTNFGEYIRLVHFYNSNKCKTKKWRWKLKRNNYWILLTKRRFTLSDLKKQKLIKQIGL
jgi:hypothetical protein